MPTRACFHAVLQQRQAAILEGWAAADPNGAYAQVMGMPAANARGLECQAVALQAMVSGMADAGNFSGAAAMFASNANMSASS